MNKLIIQHGERVTEHPIGEQPLVVGRDPQCDLFFADKKLSRRHARFERQGGGVKLVDLGSRNGSWVNEERVNDRVLASGDEVRLGGLHISLETEPFRDDQESTVFLEADPSADDSRTVILDSEGRADRESPPDTGTVILAANAPPAPVPDDNEDPTLEKPDTENSAQTMMYQGEKRQTVTDTGTVIFRGKVDPNLEAATRIAPPGPGADLRPEEGRGDRSEPFEPADASLDLGSGARPAPEGSIRYVALVAGIVALAFVVLALPLLRTLGNAFATESSRRGRALVELLAASNGPALRQGHPQGLSVARVTGEPGVVGAYILDPSGRVLAPRDAARTRSLLESLGVPYAAEDVRTLRTSVTADGASVFAQPVIAEGRRLGIAVLHYRVGDAVSTWTVMMLLLGSVLLLMGVSAAVLLARRWALAPVHELRGDVEALWRGVVDALHEERPHADLVAIARHVNELVRRRDRGSSGGASATYKPVLDPTLIPDERDRREADR